MKTIINKNLKDLSIEQLKKKENDTKLLMFIVFFFGIFIFRSYWYFALIFLAVLWTNLQEIQKELASREQV